LAWTIEYDAAARKDLSRLDKQVSRRIAEFMRERVDNPHSLGRALQGSGLGQLWRYRVGDYRIICDIQDAKVILLMLHAGHGREVYR
jgi:mRNA interferase RelE/StbE